MNFVKKIFSDFFYKYIIKTKRISQSVDYSTYLRMLLDYFEIPNKRIYNKITEYYTIYKRNLSESKVLISKDVGDKDYYERRNMIFDLIQKNFIDEMDNVLSEKNIIKKIIMLKKFELYLNEIKDFFVDTMSRLVALNEIKEKEEIPESESASLDSEIENMSNSVIIINNRIEGMKHEISAYQSVINTLMMDRIKAQAEDIEHVLKSSENRESLDNQDIDIQNIEDMYHNLAEKVKEYIDLSDIEESNEDYYTKMAMLEKRLEEYFYKNPNFIKIIFERAKDISIDFETTLNSITEEQYQELHFKDYTNRILKLDEQFKIYDKYKYKSSIDEDLKKEFYKMKMRIIIYANLQDTDTSNFFYDDELANKAYREEIEERLNRIIKEGDLKIPFSEKNFLLWIKTIKRVFLSNIGSFDTDAIFTNKYLLTLLFALDSPHLLKRWFDGKVDRKKFLGNKLNNRFFEYEPHIKFDSNLPISTICEVLRENTSFKNDSSMDAKAINSLVDLYKLCIQEVYTREIDSKHYSLPEGIVEIGEPSYMDEKQVEIFIDLVSKIKKDFYYLRLQKNTRDKIVKMPSSLRVFRRNDAIDKNVRQLEFSNGIKKVNFYCYKVMNIIISPSVEELEIDFKDIDYEIANPYGMSRRMVFLDYENSVFLNPKDLCSQNNANRFFNNLPDNIWIDLCSINGSKRSIQPTLRHEEYSLNGVTIAKDYKDDEEIPITEKVVIQRKDGITPKNDRKEHIDNEISE